MGECSECDEHHLDVEWVDNKNRGICFPAKMTDLPDFKPKKLEMVKVETFEADDSGVMVNSDDVIYYINYDGGPF